jgi:sugar lactone lactonase YvrE
VLDRDHGRLIIAMAGPHQLWTYDLATGVTQAWVGSGRENIVDGSAADAQLAQPSGLAIHEGHVYFADSEVSAVRRAALSDGRVETLIGTGLFDFGHRDGDWSAAQLQHCLAVASFNGDILVADTYNDAVRRISLKDRTIETVLGGPGENALDEPAGLAVLDGQVYIADTNNHRIVRFDPATGRAEPLKIQLPQ